MAESRDAWGKTRVERMHEWLEALRRREVKEASDA